jgi:ATP-dependent Lon protease
MTPQAPLADELLTLQINLAESLAPEELKRKAQDMLTRLGRMVDSGVYSAEYDRLSHYIDWVINLPWGKYTNDNIDIAQASGAMDKTHYGMSEPKERILEFLSTMKLRAQNQTQEEVRAPAIFLVGLVGTGKTTFAYTLANVLGRKFARIPFGGLGSARDLRGRSRLFPEAEPGYIVKALKDAGSMNPIILLDEIDRVGESERMDIMGVLVELLDPTQNNRFLDQYLDFPLDLSQVMFIATANNTPKVATAVLDRLELIQMPSYTDEEKIHITQKFILPKAMASAGLQEGQLTLDPAIWPLIVRPLGYDAGIRTLERTMASVVRKVAKQIVEGQATSVHLDQTNYKQYMISY